MRQKWEMDELVEHFTLLPHEMELISNKTGPTRLGFAVLLKVFQHEARFPIWGRTRKYHYYIHVAPQYANRFRTPRNN